MLSAAPTVSVVIPCYNEELVLDALYDRMSRVCENLGSDYEIVLINDGSKDRTWEKMADLAARDPNLVCVNLTRNHGHQLALTAGLSVCTGEQILVIDADLQDPPEVLPEMMALMAAEGADVVYGQRTKRDGETLFKKITAHIFYRTLAWLADNDFPRDTGDFRLMTRRVLDQFLAMPERHRYVRGMISWIGYKQVPYKYERHARHAGETNYTVKRMVRFAMDAITSFSVKPLTLSFRAGALCQVFSMLTVVLAGIWWVVYSEVPTVGLLTALVLMLGGGQFLTLGVIGEYLGRMYAEVRGRPLYLIEQVLRNRAVAVPQASRREVA